MSLESKAKTVYELMQKRKEWLEDFSAGALGNQEAYDRARENRPLYEQGVKYVPLVEAQRVVDLLAKVLGQACEYEDMMESKVKLLERDIELYERFNRDYDAQISENNRLTGKVEAALKVLEGCCDKDQCCIFTDDGVCYDDECLIAEAKTILSQDHKGEKTN